MTSIRITGGQVLLDHDGLVATDLGLADCRIAAIGGTRGKGIGLDASGLLVLPGIVDIHGDAFERQIQPRPGVDFPMGIALRDTERQLLANGITTAFHGVTLSWEPGLRSLGSWQALLTALEAERWTCDMRVHLRWEAYNLDALDIAVADIAAGRVHLLAFNDHTPAILHKLKDPVEGAKYAGRAGMAMHDFQAFTDRVAARADEVPAALQRIAAAAREAGLPMASHDDDTLPVRARFRSLGADICEFPMAEAVGRDARAQGEHVVMGSPNVVRGRSHLNWTSAATMAEAGICDILSSDYYYPAMARAAFILTDRGAFDIARAWALIAANPASAAGLTDRGSIEVGKRADLVLMEPAGRTLVATIANGRLAHLTAEGAARLTMN
ncbi:MAG TPA: alpha-D-ribose 1-methylphosphonate 5-triphosphate diphosphatase [Acetobacteraceae bacterium]|nr:alpha-D-ribose 1-methylphosphonate 5-triphosphate diphosphatase [Acetobacteraceae bacterium]